MPFVLKKKTLFFVKLLTLREIIFKKNHTICDCKNLLLKSFAFPPFNCYNEVANSYKIKKEVWQWIKFAIM